MKDLSLTIQKLMANVKKIFADKHAYKRTGQKLYVPDLSMREHKNGNELSLSERSYRYM